MFFHQMGDDLCVRFGDELVALILKLLFERQIVFDDAVVHDHDLSAAIAMGMSVFLGWTAVRRPTCVADAVCALDRAHADGVFEGPQLAGGAAHGKTSVVSDDHYP